MFKRKAEYTDFNVSGEMGGNKTKLITFITMEWAIVFSIFAVIMVFFILLSVLVSKIFFIPLVIIGLFWGLVAGTSEKIEKSKIVSSFFYRKWKGETIIAKYRMEDSVVKKHFPIEEIHEDGIIEYSTGNHYGMMLKVDPPRVRDIESYTTALESVWNAFIPGDLFKIMACSRLNEYKPYADEILATANQDETTDEQRKHIHSIYQMIENEDEETVEWQFNAVLIFEAEDIDDAIIIAETRLPGMKDLFNNAGVSIYQMKNKLDIQVCLYQQLQREVIRI